MFLNFGNSFGSNLMGWIELLSANAVGTEFHGTDQSNGSDIANEVEPVKLLNSRGENRSDAANMADDVPFRDQLLCAQGHGGTDWMC